MKIIIILITALCTISHAFAQTSELEELRPDTLRTMIAASSKDAERVRLLIALGRSVLFKAGAGKAEIDTAVAISSDAMKLSKALAFNNGTVNAMLLTALCLNAKGLETKGRQIAEGAFLLARRFKDNKGMAESYIVLGQNYKVTVRDQLAKRINEYDKAIVLFRSEHDNFRLTSVLKDQAEHFFLDGRRMEAIRLLFEALNTGAAVNYKRLHGIYWMIGRTSTEIGDYPSAVRYNLLAIKTAKDRRDSSLTLCSIYNTMALTLTSMKQFKEAIPYSLAAMKIARHYGDRDYIGSVAINLAIEYTRTGKIKKALPLLEEISQYVDNDIDRLTVMENFLVNLILAKQFKKAAWYAGEVKRLSADLGQSEDMRLMPVCNYLAEYYLETGQPGPARYYNDRYSKLVHKIGYAAGIRTVEKHNFQIDSMNGDFRSAIGHYQAAQRIKDSIDNVTKAYQISLLQIENDTEQKKNDIEELTRQTLAKDSQLKRKELIQATVVSACVLLAVITALLYSRYRLKQRSNNLLLSQKLEIDLQNVELQELVNEKNVLLFEKDDLLSEKDLLLREVNHRVKNNLQIVMSLLATPQGRTKDERAQQVIRDSQNRVQSIVLIHEQLFANDRITEVDLPLYISELVGSLDRSLNEKSGDISIICKVEEIMMDVSQAIPLGIILNEAVTNALKYAFPDGRKGIIRVSVTDAGKDLTVHISDSGVGLPASGRSGSGSLGMTLIEGLTRQLKGRLRFENSGGLTIIICFPKEVNVRAAGTIERRQVGIITAEAEELL